MEANRVPELQPTDRARKMVETLFMQDIITSICLTTPDTDKGTKNQASLRLLFYWGNRQPTKESPQMVPKSSGSSTKQPPGPFFHDLWVIDPSFLGRNIARPPYLFRM